jgi:hypothetical protein
LLSPLANGAAQKLENGSAVMLHACAHNPTGVDPKKEQWAELSKLFKDKGLFPVIDMAYQGFASGDCDYDAQGLRQFIKDGHQVHTPSLFLLYTAMSAPSTSPLASLFYALIYRFFSVHFFGYTYPPPPPRARERERKNAILLLPQLTPH